MKLIIAGSRTIDNLSKYFIRDLFKNLGIDFNNPDVLHEIVSGTAKGVDTCGEHFAKSYNIPLIKFPANWDNYGKKAGFIRNKQMSEYADGLVLIWDGESKGSASMKKLMIDLNKPVYEIIIKKVLL